MLLRELFESVNENNLGIPFYRGEVPDAEVIQPKSVRDAGTEDYMRVPARGHTLGPQQHVIDVIEKLIAVVTELRKYGETVKPENRVQITKLVQQIQLMGFAKI